MRPTVHEQLEGMCRILETSVATELGNAYTQETLRGVVANLRMLDRAWPRLLPFLHWDNDAMRTLLADARGVLTGDAASALTVALDAPPADPFDFDAADALNERLRGLLGEALRGPAPLRARIAAHLATRAERFPLRITGAQPKKKT